MAKAFTLATYRVLPGKEVPFVAAWNRLAETFSALPRPPYWGTLIRSTRDPGLFHSFGPWETADDIAAMRTDPAALACFKEIAALCEEMTPGDYEIVTHVAVREEAAE